MAVFLDEIVDDTYEPSKDEIAEYAEWLGMNPEEDQELMWVARDGLMAPLPAEWKPCREANDGDIFYFNMITQESVWEHPCDDHYIKKFHREKAKLNAPVRVVTISGCLTTVDTLTVTCVGSLTGEEIAVLTMKSGIKVRGFRSWLSKRLEVSKRCLRIIMPDGRILSEEVDTCLLAKELDIETPVSVKEEVNGKEVRVNGYSHHCRNSARLPLHPEAKAGEEVEHEDIEAGEEVEHEDIEQRESFDDEEQEGEPLDTDFAAKTDKAMCKPVVKRVAMKIPCAGDGCRQQPQLSRLSAPINRMKFKTL